MSVLQEAMFNSYIISNAIIKTCDNFSWYIFYFAELVIERMRDRERTNERLRG